MANNKSCNTVNNAFHLIDSPPHLSSPRYALAQGGIPKIPKPALMRKRQHSKNDRIVSNEGINNHLLMIINKCSLKSVMKRDNDIDIQDLDTNVSCCSVSSSSSSSQKELQSLRLQLWQMRENDVQRRHSNQDVDQYKMNHGHSQAHDKWGEYWDQEVGATYYYNEMSREARWENPRI